MSSLLKSLEAQGYSRKADHTFEAQCERDEDKETAQVKTKCGFALLANKNGRSTLLEKSDKIKNYIGPGTEIVQAVTTDAYLVGPIERYLNGGGQAVVVSEEIIGECFAQSNTSNSGLHDLEDQREPEDLHCQNPGGWYKKPEATEDGLEAHSNSPPDRKTESHRAMLPLLRVARREEMLQSTKAANTLNAARWSTNVSLNGTTPEERRTIRKAQQTLTAEKKKACPKADKSVQTQVVDLMECTEAQAERPEMEDQSEEEGDAPVASAGDKRKAAGRARNGFSFRAPTALPGLRKSSRKKVRKDNQTKI
ncbi:hypothetical protein CFIMG_008167RA00001 [Ceratocystis fimbriata CBS 114723]|uniref:Uncharacterized protein n=1 Tax=Ceratocystis fimbriata CBS 114723 TaxID=1035309 RepID=A0A2C5X7M9_9PEZI|nr:hypothetical protein CFIMG_008167RA00001 [Ceratocystis fimbriata CBS 114723]